MNLRSAKFKRDLRNELRRLRQCKENADAVAKNAEDIRLDRPKRAIGSNAKVSCMPGRASGTLDWIRAVDIDGELLALGDATDLRGSTHISDWEAFSTKQIVSLRLGIFKKESNHGTQERKQRRVVGGSS